MRGRAIWAVAVCYVAVRVLLVQGRGTGTRLHVDTASYREGISLFGNAPRTWVIPLLHELSDAHVMSVQALIGGTAWVVLAVALAARMTDRRVQIGTFALILILGLTPRVTFWDTMLLSESLALSFTALLIAGLAHLRIVPWWAFVAVFTLWLFTRDGHLYLGALVLLGVGWWGWQNKRWTLPAGCLIAFAWNGLAAQNDRYVEGSTAAAAIAYYSLDDIESFRWFIANDMPVSDGFINSGAEYSVIFRGIYVDDPAFREWADNEGQALVGRYLITHPARLVERMPLLFRDGGFNDESMVDHTFLDLGVKMPGWSWPWPNEASWFTFTLISVCVLSALLLSRSRRLDRRWLLPGLLVASTVPHAWMASIASPYEYARHGVILAFVLVLGCWWMIALAVDAVLGDADGVVSEHTSFERSPATIGFDVPIVDTSEHEPTIERGDGGTSSVVVAEYQPVEAVGAGA